MTARTVLVTGATGLQGGATARRLQADGHRVVALVRDPASVRAAALVDAGITLAEGDFDAPETVARAAAGLDAAFVIGTPTELGPDGERRQATAVLDSVVAAGVGHVVYSSAAAADRGTGIPWFESKRTIEDHVRTLPTTWTIIAAAVFMDVVLAPHVVASLRQGILQMALPAPTTLQYADVADIAGCVAMALARPDEFAGRRLEIASDERTGEQLAATLSAASGRPISYVESSLDELSRWDSDLGHMFRWFRDVGFGIDIGALHARYPEVGWHSFDAWSKARSWAVLDSAAPAGSW